MSGAGSPVGLGLGSGTRPADLAPLAALAEAAGFGELWLTEDCFFTAGISATTAALGATTSMPVGTGAVSVMTRHPAVLAMETATLAGMYPGRARLGLGLGVPEWLDQMGLRPGSPLTALREGVTALRGLLRGDTVDLEGEVFTVRDVRLDQPPQIVPPIYLAATGPKMLALSGELVDGTLGSVLAGTTYVAGMRDLITAGQARSAGSRHHRIVVLALYAVDRDAALARAAARHEAAFYLSISPRNPLSDAYGITEELADMVDRAGNDPASVVEREMPERWLDDLVVAGDPDACADGVKRLLAAGADSVCLCPAGGMDVAPMIGVTAEAVLPQL